MVSIARRNLFHDKGRFAITLIGVATSMVLISFSIGMCFGTLDEMVAIIDHTTADVWVLQEGNKNLISPSLIPDTVTNQVARVQGVKDVHRLIHVALQVNTDGDQLPVTLNGFDLEGRIGAPWDLRSGDIDGLGPENTIIVDQSVEKKLGPLAVGDSVSANGIPLTVVGVSRNAKSFVNPFVFTSYEAAVELCRLRPGDATFLLVRVQPGTDPQQVAEVLSAIDGVGAFTAEEVRQNTRSWMLAESGMGIGLGTMAVVGLFVAAIITALTIYTATMERIPEFGVLKAIGASKADIYKILLEQVLISVTLGCAVGVLGGLALSAAVTRVTLMPVKVPPATLTIVYVLALLLSGLSSLLSVRPVNRVDPAIVFRA